MENTTYDHGKVYRFNDKNASLGNELAFFVFF
jgi:hypothetical protein